MIELLKCELTNAHNFKQLNNVVIRQIFRFGPHLAIFSESLGVMNNPLTYAPSPVCSKSLFKSLTILENPGNGDRFQRLP
jgi:hypothetical protein